MTRRTAIVIIAVAFACAAVAAGEFSTASTAADPFPLDPAGDRWVEQTLARMTVDEKVGQLIVPAFETRYISTDSDAFDRLARFVREAHVGGFHLFGASEPVPQVLLNPHYGSAILGQPLVAAAILNRLQALSPVPLLNSADFETGLGFRLAGATTFPREMAFGAVDDERAVYEAAKITAQEARAIGVQVNLAPVADVNSNPRNPVINTRSFGANPERVAALVAAYVDGARAGGGIAALKHFPGHGDTDTDTHLGLAVLMHDRATIDRMELPPFRAGIAHGAAAVMTSHIVVPGVEPEPGTPATFSGAITTGLLRRELGFNGLVYTDSLRMDSVAKLTTPEDAAVRAILAGADQLLDSQDPFATFAGARRAVADGRVTQTRLNESVRRILRAKAWSGLHRQKTVDVEGVLASVGSRAHLAVARDVSARAITLVKDEHDQVPLAVGHDAQILYLSILDYPSGWGIAAPSRTFIPELKKRWPNVTAIELSDRTELSDLNMVRVMASRYAAIVASVFVRVASGSGRMDLAPELSRLLQDLARDAARTNTPVVVCLFGNPYVASMIPAVPAILVTYDLYDLAEESAVKAIAGETAIGGRLPVPLPGVAELGAGLRRSVKK